MKWILSKFRTHNWEVESAEPAGGVLITRMKCSRCEKMSSYATLDRSAFIQLYRMRGCKGATPNA